jgi:hypothetical protein
VQDALAAHEVVDGAYRSAAAGGEALRFASISEGLR